MAVFRVEKNKGYTVMSNHHLRNIEPTLKAKDLLSQMLSLPETWDYTLAGLSRINREKIDTIREAVRELEHAGYIVRSRERDDKGRLRGADYIIYEQLQTPHSDLSRPDTPCDNGKQRVAQHGAKLLKIPAGARLSSISNHGMRRHLFGAGTDHSDHRRHIRRDMGLHGLYRPAVLLPL